MTKKVRYGMIAAAIMGIVVYLFVIRNPLKQDPQKIIIRNGTTGEETILIGENKDQFMAKLSEIEPKISGFHLWTSGYRYMIFFEDNGRTRDITTKGKNRFVSGIIEYTTDIDIISIMEEFTSSK
ncbi:MAG TPA: hypothetical protein DEF30_08910 [Proteiniclasticum sp.]|uniref:hypothetical protein n=1 Tax=Proteiniclasticum sp. TaxID=2053595 RepID=UPI000E86E0ED|nr:hypothetical protein [Proteiniclasticum sp.]HBW13922.1 hypothetical protein [Proteiniclasticum sp.]